MAALPVILAVAGTTALIGGAVLGATAQVQKGAADKADAYATAADMETVGNEDFAQSQRDANDAKTQGQLLASTQQAIAAASGGGAVGTPTIERLLTETGARTDYAVQAALYKGASTQKRYYAQAKQTRMTGDASLVGGWLSGLGTLAGGVGRAAGAYNG